MSVLKPSMNPALRGVAEWQSASGALMLGHCNACGKPHYYPRGICPFCQSMDVGRIDAAGTGQIYSYVPMESAEGSYVIAYVTLDEGVTMLTNIIDAEPERVSCGARVKLVFQDVDGEARPYFRLA